MKTFILGTLLMSFSNLASSQDIFEVVSMMFKEGISLEQQQQEMEKLNIIVGKYEGFKSRDYYYSEENGRWIDFVVWSSYDLAKKASEQAMKDPEAGSIFAKMDDKTMIFSHYKRIGGIKK